MFFFYKRIKIKMGEKKIFFFFFFFAETSTTKGEKLLPKLPPKASQRQPQRLKEDLIFVGEDCISATGLLTTELSPGLDQVFFPLFFSLSASKSGRSSIPTYLALLCDLVCLSFCRIWSVV